MYTSTRVAMKQRLAIECGEKNRYTNQQLREMGDRAPEFRYTI